MAATWLNRLAEPDVSISSAWSCPMPAPIARDPPPLRQMPTVPADVSAATAAAVSLNTGATKLPEA
jgi:hypothetical protein